MLAGRRRLLVATTCSVVLLAGTGVVRAKWDSTFYGPPEDHSRFIDARLLADQRTCLFSFYRYVYRPAQGVAAFPDGGIPKYLEDVAVLGAVDVETGRVRVLARQPNTDWTPGSGEFRIHSACGPRALVTQGGQRRHNLSEMADRSFWLDLQGGGVRMVDFKEELARLGRARGIWHLLTPEGLTLHVTAPAGRPDSPLVQNPEAELWLRDTDGRYERVGSGEYYGCQGTRIFFWDLAARKFYAYDWTTRTAAERPGNDPDYVAGLDVDGPCGAARSRTRACRVDDGQTLLLEERRDETWRRTPIPVSTDRLR